MKLLVISHTPHYKKEGRVVGWGATVREIDQLAKLFSEVVHIAPLHEEAAPASSLPYENASITLRPVLASVGDGFFHHLDLLLKMPVYGRIILDELKRTDAVHVRCPAAISLFSVVFLFFVKNPKIRWIKYAGNWRPVGREPRSYTFQRWWLEKNFHRGLVTVNGKWPGQPAHIHSFLNPCLTTEELKEAETLSRGKKLSEPLRLLFAGRLETEKGAGRCLQIGSELFKKKISFYFDFIGDDPEREKFEAMARDLQINQSVKFHGWLSRQRLNALYAEAHFILLPSTASEGWPKVLSEAMGYGIVPLASTVGGIPCYLREMKIGGAFDPRQVSDFVDSLCGYLHSPEKWRAESILAMKAAGNFSYDHYLKAVEQLLFKGVPS